MNLLESPYLHRYSLPAERARGLVFAERFESSSAMTANGAESISGSLTIEDNTMKDPSGLGFSIYRDGAGFVGASDFTVSFWINPANDHDGSGEKQVFLSAPTAPQINMTITDDSGRVGWPRTVLNDGVNSPDFVYGPGALVTGEWNHIALAVDRSGNAICYLNGVAGTPELVNAVATLDNSSPQLLISAANATYPADYRDFRVYRSVLSAGEVQDIWSHSTFKYLAGEPRHLPMTASRRNTDMGGEAWAVTGATKLAEKGYSFDGNDYLTAPSLTFDSGFTGLFCFQSDGLLFSQKYGWDSTANRTTLLFTSTRRIDCAVGNGSFLQVAEATWAPVFNTVGLNAIVVTGDSTDTKMWLNGTLIGTKTSGLATFPFDPGALYLGRFNASNSFNYRGEVYETGFLNKRLTDTQAIDACLRLVANGKA